MARKGRGGSTPLSRTAKPLLVRGLLVWDLRGRAGLKVSVGLNLALFLAPARRRPGRVRPTRDACSPRRKFGFRWRLSRKLAAGRRNRAAREGDRGSGPLRRPIRPPEDSNRPDRASGGCGSPPSDATRRDRRITLAVRPRGPLSRFDLGEDRLDHLLSSPVGLLGLGFSKPPSHPLEVGSGSDLRRRLAAVGVGRAEDLDSVASSASICGPF